MWTWYFLDSTGQITADRNISITSIIWIATVLLPPQKIKSLFMAHMWITNSTIIAQMIDWVIFGFPVSHISVSVCVRHWSRPFYEH